MKLVDLRKKKLKQLAGCVYGGFNETKTCIKALEALSESRRRAQARNYK